MLSGEHLKIPQIELQSEFIVKTLEEEDKKTPKKSGRAHRHNFYTLIWIQEGSGTHQIDFKDYPIESNTIHFVSPQQVHWFKNNPGIKGWLFLFNVNFLESSGMNGRFMQALQLFTGYTQPEALKVPKSEEKKLQEYCHRAHLETDPNRNFHQEAASSIIKLFLIECSRIKQSLNINSANKVQEIPSSNRILSQFLENLELHFQEKHKVSEFAELQAITPNYLNEVIKVSSGRSAKEHIQSRLLLEAMRYATHSEMNTKETAYTLGFDDPAHFSKFFKKMKGQDFTTFRELVKSK